MKEKYLEMSDNVREITTNSFKAIKICGIKGFIEELNNVEIFRIVNQQTYAIDIRCKKCDFVATYKSKSFTNVVAKKTEIILDKLNGYELCLSCDTRNVDKNKKLITKDPEDHCRNKEQVKLY